MITDDERDQIFTTVFTLVDAERLVEQAIYAHNPTLSLEDAQAARKVANRALSDLLVKLSLPEDIR